MITAYTITGTAWTVITSAGESGSCWLDEEGDGSVGAVEVRLYHSATGEPAAAKVTEGKKIYRPGGNTDICNFSADSGSDIYYARCLNANDQAIMIVDVI